MTNETLQYSQYACMYYPTIVDKINFSNWLYAAILCEREQKVTFVKFIASFNTLAQSLTISICLNVFASAIRKCIRITYYTLVFTRHCVIILTIDKWTLWMKCMCNKYVWNFSWCAWAFEFCLCNICMRIIDI